MRGTAGRSHQLWTLAGRAAGGAVSVGEQRRGGRADFNGVAQRRAGSVHCTLRVMLYVSMNCCRASYDTADDRSGSCRAACQSRCNSKC